MPFILEDGLGSGVSAGISADNKLFTRSITSTELSAGSILGTTFVIDALAPTLTSTSESGIIYLKNTDPNNFIKLDAVDISLGKGNTIGDTLIKIYTNPTGGTLISAGTTIIPYNRNLGQNTPALAVAFAGTEGKTITGGTLVETWIFQNGTFTGVDLSPAMPNGYSIALSITPPTGNTSVKVNMAIRFLYTSLENI